jgi:hypothetical protein
LSEEILLEFGQREWFQSGVCENGRRGWLKIASATFESLPGNPTALNAGAIFRAFFLVDLG